MRIQPLLTIAGFALAVATSTNVMVAQDEEGNGRVGAAPESDLSAIAGWIRFRSAPDSLYRHLTDEAYAQLDERNRRVRAIDSAFAWKAQQEQTRKALLETVAPFPERTPLNARILRTIEKTDYRIEHIVFESQPGFFVTSSLFLPRNLTGRAPVVLYCSGHSDSGYRGAYVRTILNFVNKGFIVFAWDPVGQGERVQYLDAAGKSVVGTGTKQHAFMTVQAMLTGSSLARYVIWDGIRAVDYLLTRPEVDPARIGATGRSGGGFQSLYIPAFDDRIYATAPENHVTNETRILQKIGPRDGEQNLFQMFARGIDHPDLLEVRAPKPTLVVATANDIFNIDGTRETVQEAMLAYLALGGGENLTLVEDIAGHQSTTQNNETIYAFFQKHLNNPGSSKTEQVEMPGRGEMQVTATGQVGSSFDGVTVAGLSRREGDQLFANLAAEAREGRLTAARIIAAAKRQSGFRPPASEDRPVLTGSARRDGYVIQRYFVKGEGDYPIPYVSIEGDQPNGKAILYLHPGGKSAEGGKGQEIEWLVRQGYKVLAPDLVGTGEAGPGDSAGDKDFAHSINTGISYHAWYVGMFIGRSVLGVRAADAVKLAGILKAEGAREVIGVAHGAMGPVLLHAAAFADAITRVAVLDSPASYHSLVVTEMYAPKFIETFVPGVLRFYDLPHLAGALAPRRVVLHHSVDGGDHPMSNPAVATEYAAAVAAYSAAGGADRLQFTDGEDGRAALAKLLRE